MTSDKNVEQIGDSQPAISSSLKNESLLISTNSTQSEVTSNEQRLGSSSSIKPSVPTPTISTIQKQPLKATKVKINLTVSSKVRDQTITKQKETNGLIKKIQNIYLSFIKLIYNIFSKWPITFVQYIWKKLRIEKKLRS